MKLKNIISAMCVLASAFTACVNEMPVDGPDVGQPGELSIVFAVGDAQTKATSASEGNYVYATDEEVQIDNIHVALFNAASHARIKSSNVFDEASGEWEDGKKTYKTTFTDISVKDNPSVYAVVIANYSGKSNLSDQAIDFSSCENFDAYKKVVKESAGFADTTQLMKVGKSAETEIAVNAINKVVVPLTQLTARIDFKGVIVGDEPKTKALATKAGEVIDTLDVSYAYLGEGAVTDSILTVLQNWIKDNVSKDVTWEPHAAGLESSSYSYSLGWNDGWRYYYKDWEASIYGGYYEERNNKESQFWISDNYFLGDKISSNWAVPTYYQNRAILVSKTYTEIRTVASSPHSLSTKSGSDGKQFVVENVVYSGFNTQSDVAIFDNTTVENRRCVPYTAIDKTHEGNTPFSFYTYERPKGDNPIKLSITGHFTEDGGSTEPPVEPDPDPATETKEVTEYGYMIQSRGNGWPSNAPDSNELAENASAFKPVITVKKEKTGETKSSSPVTKATSASKTYTLELSQYDFIKGNCYSLTGYVKESNLEWVIEKLPWEEKSVNVNFGGNWGNK